MSRALPTELVADGRLHQLTRHIVREVLRDLRHPPLPIAPEYLSPRQAADFTGIPVKTLELYRSTGAGPRYFKLGDGPRARIRYRVDDLRAFVEARGAEE